MGLSVARGSAAPASIGSQPPDRQTQLALYALMVNMRFFEKRVFDLYLENLGKGPAHLGRSGYPERRATTRRRGTGGGTKWRDPSSPP